MMYHLLSGLVFLMVSTTEAFPDGNSIPDANDVLPRAKTCAQTSGCKAKTFTDADKNARCFGTYACANAVFETTNNVVCAGAATCYHASQSGLSPRILCSGYKACQRSQGEIKDSGMTSPKEIICQGFQTCTAMRGGMSAPVIRCDGDLACSNKKSDIAQNDMDLFASDELFCNGKVACHGSVIETPYAYCDGEAACAESTMQVNTVECHGKRVCAKATINGEVDFKVQLFGFLAAAKATIAMPDRAAAADDVVVSHGKPLKKESTQFIINAFGAKAMVGATVRNDGKEFILNAFGYKATARATLACSQAVPCEVNCKGNGCANLEITVSVNNDAYFKVSPDLCDTANAEFEFKGNSGCKPPKVAGIQCPYIFRKKGSYPQPICTEEARKEVEAEWAAIDAEIASELAAEEAETDQFIEDLIEDFDEMQFLNEKDEEKLDAYFESLVSSPTIEAEELHVAAVTVSSSSSSLASTTMSSIIVSNLVTALSVVGFLSVALWCYVKHQSNKGDYKGLAQ